MGKLAKIKTTENDLSVESFIAKVPDEKKRKDSQTLINMMSKATNAEPKMWGSSIIGFGNKRYKSPNTEREVDWFRMGFSPRKANLVLYLFLDPEAREKALQKLGKHKTGAGCIYINKLEDVDMKVLEGMIGSSAKNK